MSASPKATTSVAPRRSNHRNVWRPSQPAGSGLQPRLRFDQAVTAPTEQRFTGLRAFVLLAGVGQNRIMLDIFGRIR